MVIKIYTYADKRPDFIPYQFKSLKFFLTDEFEYIVFNNSSNVVNRWKINNQCRKLGIKVYPIKNPSHSSPNIACAYPLQWSFHKIIKYQKENIAVVLDSDMFLLKKFNIEEYLDGFDIAGTKQIREKIKYLWNGILFLNIQTLPNKKDLNFMCGKIEGTATDVGGYLHYYFIHNPQVRVKNILHTSRIYSKNNNLNVLPKEILKRYDENFCFELYENAFFHYGRGSNWDKMSREYHKEKTSLAFDFIDGCIKGNIKLPYYNYVFDKDCWK